MRLIGVVDLLGGRAVHARGGRRERYAEVASVAGAPIDGDALRLAQRYASLGLGALYVADLDAIRGATSQDAITRALTAHASLWLDAGVSSTEQAEHCFEIGVARVIVGLETLTSWQALERIARTFGPERVVFSLDLRDGMPIGDVAAGAGRRDAVGDVAARAVDAGASAVIVLDVARVGIGVGPDVATIAGVRQRAPGVALFAGGGVRDADDLARLAAAGCDGALVATAVQTGRLDATAIAAARHVSATR